MNRPAKKTPTRANPSASRAAQSATRGRAAPARERRAPQARILRALTAKGDSQPRTCTRARLVELPLAHTDRLARILFAYDTPLPATPCAVWGEAPPGDSSPQDPRGTPARDGHPAG
ncbi:MAG: hypothetical protein IT376_07700 [Polyangiaceae bacterium]|nr:hypothetical protein [Polyangiaceae bacterium]